MTLFNMERADLDGNKTSIQYKSTGRQTDFIN